MTSIDSSLRGTALGAWVHAAVAVPLVALVGCAHQTDPDTPDDGASPSSSDSACGTPRSECPAGAVRDCNEIDADFEAGEHGTCLPDCSGWDVALCQETSTIQPYGSLAVGLRCDFVLDVSRIGDVSYQRDHLDAIVSVTPAFWGTLGGSAWPSPDVADFEILVLRDQDQTGAQITVVQQAFDSNARLVNPVVELRLPVAPYEPDVDIEVCHGAGVVAFVYDLTEQFRIDCFHAVTGEGSMRVETAEDLEELDGGRLHLSATHLDLYHPTESPHGDISTQLNFPTCNKGPEPAW